MVVNDSGEQADCLVLAGSAKQSDPPNGVMLVDSPGGEQAGLTQLEAL
jgi:hypothetical protein